MNNNILIWNQCINDWITNVKLFFTKYDDKGLKFFSTEWTKYNKILKKIENMDIADIMNYTTVYTSLHDITATCVTNEFKKYVVNYDVVFEKINDNHLQCEILYNKLLSKSGIHTIVTDLLKKYDIHDFIKKYDNISIDNKLGLFIMIYICNTYNYENCLYFYKKKLLGVNYEINNNIHNIHKINFLIKPLHDYVDNTTKFINIQLNQVTSYNILPLIDKISALQFGELLTNNHGINMNMINRFKNITVENVKNNKTAITNTGVKFNDHVIVYNGKHFIKLNPCVRHNVNDNDNDNDNDNKHVELLGCSNMIYNLNNIQQTLILKNMIIKSNAIDLQSYKNIKDEDIDNALHRTSMKKIYNLFYEYVTKKISIIKIDDINHNVIKNEIYMLLFYNMINIIKNTDKDYSLIPLKIISHFFKLI